MANVDCFVLNWKDACSGLLVYPTHFFKGHSIWTFPEPGFGPVFWTGPGVFSPSHPASSPFFQSRGVLDRPRCSLPLLSGEKSRRVLGRCPAEERGCGCSRRGWTRRSSAWWGRRRGPNGSLVFLVVECVLYFVLNIYIFWWGGRLTLFRLV